MSDVPEAKLLDETPIRVPKRRGRKRKSEIPLPQVKEVIETPPRVETVSRRGRPRKKVNYYELANPENVEYATQLKNQIDYLTELEVTQTAKKSKLEPSSSFSEGTDEEKIPETVNGNQKEAEKSFVNGNESTGSVEVNATLEDDDANNSKDKRYSYTGETVKMMNTLFTMFATSDSAAVQENGATRNTVKVEIREEAEIEDSSGNVTCAICNTALDKSLWSHHKQRYHNNLAWRMGDTPLDLNDQQFVMSTLNSLYKKKKPLYCDKCGEVKKSVVGFLSHRSQCLKSGEQLESVKIACEICGRRMLPVSMSTHIKTIHSNPTEKSVPERKSDSKPLASKRSAAKKAMKIIESATKNEIQEKYYSTNLDLGSLEFAKDIFRKELNATQFIECKFNCNCITTSMEDALDHLKECIEKPEAGFVCKTCLFISVKLEDMIFHIESSHEITVQAEESDNSDDGNYGEKESSRLPMFLQAAGKRRDKTLFYLSYEWTFKFCEENYSQYLFSDLIQIKSDWLVLPPNMVPTYAPKLSTSCDVGTMSINSFVNPLKNEHSYDRYKLFQSKIDDNKLTLFCGGPVSSMAWLPTSHRRDNQNQILAVAVLNSPDGRYLTADNYNIKCAIQFWNFGILTNKTNGLVEPKLICNLVFDAGPVWHMEWCPSGCHGEERIGLLAVTGSNSVVYIYSIPRFPEDLGLYYKPKAVIKLLLQRSGDPLMGSLKYYPCRISWSKALGHQYLSVGYTNGFVALFNLKCSSPMLNCVDSEGVKCLLPLKLFQAHSHAVIVLTLYHLNNGRRWLLTGSIDRRVNIWDLENPTYPIHSFKKNVVTDGFWLTNWLCHLTSSDEASTSLPIGTLLKPVRDYLSDHHGTLAFSQSTISCATGSDWLNGFIHGNAVGEIVGLFPHQLYNISELQKLLRAQRLLFGYCFLLDKRKTPVERFQEDQTRKKVLSNLNSKKVLSCVKISSLKTESLDDRLFVDEPLLYEEAQERYALLFCDNPMKTFNDFSPNSHKHLLSFSKSYETTIVNRYPLRSINKMAFNPNKQSSLYLATGYQAGFVRINWLEFLKGDFQVK